MTTALEGGEWSAARPGLLYPRKRPGTHCTGGWVGPRAGLDGRKISPHRDFFFLYNDPLLDKISSLHLQVYTVKAIICWFYVSIPRRRGSGVWCSLSNYWVLFVVFFFFLFFLERCRLLCGSYVVFEVLSALDASTWKSQRSKTSSVHQQGFNLGLFRGCSGNCPPVPFPIVLVLGSP